MRCAKSSCIGYDIIEMDHQPTSINFRQTYESGPIECALKALPRVLEDARIILGVRDK